jgi:hypothetical protein
MTIELAHVASWRDEPFFCVDLVEEDGNALIRSRYKHRPGQRMDNDGRLGARWSVRAVFSPTLNGRGPYPSDYWPHGWYRFRDALRKRERGWFDHALFGRAYAQAGTWRIAVAQRYRETIMVDANFEESNLSEITYDMVLGSDAVTEDGGAARAAELDDMLVALYPSAVVGVPFSTAWSILMAVWAVTDSLLTYDDVVVSLNVFHMSITATEAQYPLLMDPMNYNEREQVKRLRHDANTLAQRWAGEGKRLTTWENKSMRAAVQIAVSLYKDASREEEILLLNGDIEDPNFVPPGPYRVYSDFHPDSLERPV